MSEFVRAVTESDFEYEVIAYSQNIPVVVEFWADWCKPCKQLSPILERIVLEAAGGFRLARVDVDENPNLALRYSIRTLPTVLAFSQGTRISDFAGWQPEIRVREFVQHILPPSPANLMVQKGDSLLSQNELEEAEKAYTDALKIAPEFPGALLGLMKVILRLGKVKEAREIFHAFPACKEYNDAERLNPLIKSMEDSLSNTLPNDNDLDAAFSTSMRLAIRGNIFASLDGLMDILRQNKHFRRERGKQVVLAILELLDQEADQTKQYRKELTSILF
jgi:putative thioredoxin